MRIASVIFFVIAACFTIWYIVVKKPHEVDSFSNSQVEKRPNIVLISIDTLRADRLGCYGHNKPTSPFMDKLAKSSVLFEQSFSQAPWTLPSHMSMFTGKLPSSNRVEDINHKISKDHILLAERYKALGYETAAFVNDGQMKAHWGYARGFDIWKEYVNDTPEGNCENIISQAMDFIAKRKKDRPYFLFLHLYDVHDPYDPPARFHKTFGVELSGSQARELLWRYRYPVGDAMSPKEIDLLQRNYDACIAWVDEQLEKLHAVLDKKTAFVIFSDHGEAFEEHGWTAHGASLYREEMHVPMVLNWPGLKPVRIKTPVMLMDLTPTLMELGQLAADTSMDGEGLLSLIREPRELDRPVYCETKRLLEGVWIKNIRIGDQSFIYSVFDAKSEFYTDRDEKVNRFAELKDKEKWLGLLGQWLERENFWILTLKGSGRFEVEVALSGGQFSTFIPVGIDFERDRFMPDPKTLRLNCTLEGGKRELYFEAPVNASFRMTLKRDGKLDALSSKSYADIHKAQHPVLAGHRKIEDGFNIHHFKSKRSGPQSERSKLDQQTLEQLRSLGYIK